MSVINSRSLAALTLEGLASYLKGSSDCCRRIFARQFGNTFAHSCPFYFLVSDVSFYFFLFLLCLCNLSLSCFYVVHRNVHVRERMDSEYSFCDGLCTVFVADIHGWRKWSGLLWCLRIADNAILLWSRRHLWQPDVRRSDDSHWCMRSTVVALGW